MVVAESPALVVFCHMITLSVLGGPLNPERSEFLVLITSVYQVALDNGSGESTFENVWLYN